MLHVLLAALALTLAPASGHRASSAGAAAGADTAAVAEITALLRELDAAASARDVDRFFAPFVDGPEFAYVFNGRVMRTLADVRALHRTAWSALRRASFHTGAPLVSVEAPGVATAVATGHSERVRADGSTQAGDYAVMLVLVKRDGAWRVLQAHESTAGR